MNYQAIIFDMDGTLIDSELHWHSAELSFLNKFNIELTPEHTMKMTGRSLRESVAMVKDEYRLSETVDELLEAKNKASESIYVHQAQAMPGALELLKCAKASGLRLAIASGSSLERIKMIVDRLGWGDYFDELVSTDHVNYIGKPDPAIYRYTVEKLGLQPSDCVVLEDSVNGVRSAKGAGVPCVAIIEPRWSKGDYSEAQLQVSSLADQHLYNFLGL